MKRRNIDINNKISRSLIPLKPLDKSKDIREIRGVVTTEVLRFAYQDVLTWPQSAQHRLQPLSYLAFTPEGRKRN